MKKNAWLSLLMFTAFPFLYYFGWNYLQSLPQDRYGNIPFLEKTLGLYMILAGLALGFFGLLWAKRVCETELKYRHKQQEI